MPSREERRKQLDELTARRVVILDGAMGTMIQTHKLTEKDFRGRGSPIIRSTCRAITTC